MNEELEAKHTTLGVIAGLGCAAVLMFYAVSTGSMSGWSRSGTCTSCRPGDGISQNFGGSGSFSDTNK